MSAATGRVRTRLVTGGIIALLAFAGLIWLGTWQVHRLAWKRALITRVDARIHAPPVPAPGPALWAKVDRPNDEYRRVRIVGAYLPGRDTLTQASTIRGPGFWVMTPFRTQRGFTVLVNRGFVPKADSDRVLPARPVPVTGLLRITELGGGFLQSNDPAADRWHSRDVAAIARKRRLDDVAPYFIDAEAASSPVNGPVNGPVGGLTIISFPNNHMVYAITWYVLALMVVGGYIIFVRQTRRQVAEAGDSI